jgi:hypothetical protein
LAVDLPGAEVRTSPVHVVWYDGSPPDKARVAWPTVAAFIETVIGWFQDGTYSINSDGVVEGPSIDHGGE